MGKNKKKSGSINECKSLPVSVQEAVFALKNKVDVSLPSII